MLVQSRWMAFIGVIRHVIRPLGCLMSKRPERVPFDASHIEKACIFGMGSPRSIVRYQSVEWFAKARAPAYPPLPRYETRQVTNAWYLRLKVPAKSRWPGGTTREQPNPALYRWRPGPGPDLPRSTRKGSASTLRPLRAAPSR